MTTSPEPPPPAALPGRPVRRARVPVDLAAVRADDELARQLRRASRGDERAFAELYDATSAKVYGLVGRVVGGPRRVEEVARTAYLEIWRTSSHFDPGQCSAPAWIMTIAHRCAVDRLRSEPVDAAVRSQRGGRRVRRPVAGK